MFTLNRLLASGVTCVLNELHGKPHQLLKNGKQGRPSSVCPDASWAFERTVEGSNTTLWQWLTLVVHTVIAISLIALVAISIHDSFALRAIQFEKDASPASCERPGLRS